MAQIGLFSSVLYILFTFCFIGGTIFDNPALIKANPKYLSALKAQTKVNLVVELIACIGCRPDGSIDGLGKCLWLSGYFCTLVTGCGQIEKL